MKSGMSNKECLFERMNLIFGTQEVNKLKSHDMYLQEIENYVGAMITKETEDFTDEEMANIDERIGRKLEEYLGVLIQRQLSDLPEVMRGVYNKFAELTKREKKLGGLYHIDAVIDYQWRGVTGEKHDGILYFLVKISGLEKSVIWLTQDKIPFVKIKEFLLKDPEAELGTGITLWEGLSPVSEDDSESDLNTIRENLPSLSEAISTAASFVSIPDLTVYNEELNNVLRDLVIESQSSDSNNTPMEEAVTRNSVLQTSEPEIEEVTAGMYNTNNPRNFRPIQDFYGIEVEPVNEAGKDFGAKIVASRIKDLTTYRQCLDAESIVDWKEQTEQAVLISSDDINKLHYALMQTQDVVQSNYYWAKRQYSKEMEDTFKASTLEALHDEVATEIQLRAAKHVNNLCRQLVKVLDNLLEVCKLFEELGETRFRDDYTFITISGIRRYEDAGPNEFLRVMRRNEEVKEIAEDKFAQMFKN